MDKVQIQNKNTEPLTFLRIKRKRTEESPSTLSIYFLQYIKIYIIYIIYGFFKKK